MDRERARLDWEIAELATRQHGVISAAQLRALGLGDDAMLSRARSGRLHRLHRGVYAVGHAAPSEEAAAMAAVLACGRPDGVAAASAPRPDTHGHLGEMPLARYGAALSHRSAAVRWGLLAARPGPLDVTIPGYGGRRPRAGIRLHRSATLHSDAVTLRDGIPVTTPVRTIHDLRRWPSRRNAVSGWEVRRAIREANVRGLSIGPESGRDRTRSELERDFLRFCRRHRLPEPEVNVRVAGRLVDFFWPQQSLVVETDGYRYHRGRAAFEDDRARDLVLRSRGYEVVRLAGRQLSSEPKLVVEVLRSRLAPNPPTRPKTRQGAP